MTADPVERRLAIRVNYGLPANHEAGHLAQEAQHGGLAGNAVFIAAPRERTRHVNLGGRAFLHDYDPAFNPLGSTSELIMTAPMVVASWINLQYFASTVDARRFGSGNKVISNVVGTLGVLQGNGGDLQTGLPYQSVHNGKNFVHDSLRLSIFIEAPTRGHRARDLSTTGGAPTGRK